MNLTLPAITFVLVIPQTTIWRKAAELTSTLESAGQDMGELLLDDLAAQVLVRDLRARAAALVLGYIGFPTACVHSVRPVSPSMACTRPRSDVA